VASGNCRLGVSKAGARSGRDGEQELSREQEVSSAKKKGRARNPGAPSYDDED